MVMRAMRHGAFSGVLKFILFSLLVLAVGGLVLTDVGGFFRNGGVKNTDVAKIGRESLSIVAFDQTVNRALQSANIPAPEAYKLGYLQELLNGEIRSALMYQAAAKNGIAVSRQRIAAQVHKMVEPMVEDGEKPQEVLNKILAAQGMSEGMLVHSMAREASSGLLASALGAGFADVSDDMLRDLYQYQNETRMINIAVFSDSRLTDSPQPTDAQLEQMYESTKENYAVPETRTVVLAFLPDEKETVSISEDDIKDAYEENIDLYSTPEQRLVEQSILKTEEDAKTVISKVEGGQSLKDATGEITKDALSYIAETPFEKEGLVPEIGDVVFAQSETGKPMGPIQTALGWHVIVMKEIKEPTVKSLESVRKELEAELRETKEADQMYEAANTVDDQLAGGASLDEVTKEHNLKLVTLPAFNAFGQDENGDDALKDHEEGRETILKTAFELGDGESSNVMEMAEGRFMAINVKAITEKSYKPYSDVKDDIQKKWIVDQRRNDNKLKVMAIMAQIKAKSISLKTAAAENGVSLRTIDNIKRAGEAPAPLTPQTMPAVFDTPAGDVALVQLEDGAAIIEVAKSTFPPRDKISDKELEQMRGEYLKSVQSEGVVMYLDKQRQDAGVKVNSKLLEQTYGAGREAAEQ